MRHLYFFIFLGIFKTHGQKDFTISGMVTSNGEPLPYVNVYLNNTNLGGVTDEQGSYLIKNVPSGIYTLTASFTGFTNKTNKIEITNQNLNINFALDETEALNEVVITGTLKPVSRLESPVPVEIYSTTFLKQNPTPSIFEALQNVNGVRPQINCNVCNTGDIHINGLEGPYTLVLIDGMPIVSGLSTVYGLSGIPNSLIEQIEIVKGPASSLYGSEAVGGLINIITKLPENTSKLTLDSFVTGWGEANIDLGYKATLGKKTNVLTGINYFHYSNPIDNNNDYFTDVTLQDRISVFQKWSFNRPKNRAFSLAGRYFYEDRWGGEMNWNKSYRGGDEVYGESIYTSRFEIIGLYQLPISETINLQFSYSDHNQNSIYGSMPYIAQQRIGFGQLIWDKSIQKHDLLFGTAIRYNYYNDNTTATETADEVTIPSLLIQDEITFNRKHHVLLGARYDYDKRHGSIFTPRVAYRFKPTDEDIVRINAGTGFRVVNLFTEEHAALTGARDVILEEALEPEESYNVNINYLKKIYATNGMMFTLDASVWYTYFTNQIVPDYETNPNQIIYDNLDGHAISQGVSLNLDAVFAHGIKANIGATFQEVNQFENGEKNRQLLTERFSGNWGATYKHYPTNLSLDYTGSIYGSMLLPTLGELDPRSDESPIWSLQNIQVTYDGLQNIEFYCGVKNILNWTPGKKEPFLIARADDPFDEHVDFDSDGHVIPTPDNPYALTFDPSYVYAPNQGRRLFFGMRLNIK
ncbi:TonB-dependent receptor [Mangrovimonas sp. ST2L15]|uniref:TonB-dependent receptor n=1 Tax=Mangrovimonas sp. ST2L15 TaxID=1645916 RepID=UPI0006B4E6F7|nr:TonB-dependent receptor [Mangrovimonas sp. ST2L15]